MRSPSSRKSSTRPTERSPPQSWTTSATFTGPAPETPSACSSPEYVVGHWWEHLLHNQSALRLKTRLLFQPGVMVTSVPWQLASSQLSADAEPPAGAPVRERPPDTGGDEGAPRVEAGQGV